MAYATAGLIMDCTVAPWESGVEEPPTPGVSWAGMAHDVR
jgi:hypothetical protein